MQFLLFISNLLPNVWKETNKNSTIMAGLTGLKKSRSDSIMVDIKFKQFIKVP
jgi:hypothetical protein